MSAVMQCGKQHLSTKDMTAPEAGILLAIRHSLKSQGVKGKFNFVRGHQDDNTRFSELAREAKYNVLCDEYATNTIAENHPTKLPYPGSCAMLKIKDKWITSNMEQNLTEAATIQSIAEYTMEKYKWTKTVYNSIDWEAIKQGRKGYSKRYNIRITKLIFDWVNKGHQKAKMHQENCFPCC